MVARTEPGRAVIEQAAFWQAQLADEDCDEESRRAFRRWLQADAAHGTAYDRMTALTGRVAGRDPIQRTALGMMLDGKRQGRGLLALALIGTATAMAWIGSGNPDIRARIADEKTAVGEQQRATLASGDGLVLDSATAADIDDEARTIDLWRGAIMASVARGQPRAFVIRTPQGTARALGTQFSVRVEGGVTTVAVVESRVEMCAATGSRPCLTLAAGQSATMGAAGISRIGDVDPVAEKAWSEGLLVVDDRPLGEVLDRLNRYSRRPIRYSAGDLRGLHVSGTFPLTRPDRALTSLKAALPIAVDQADGEISVRRR